ncbi:MAG: hypothetical protein ABL997_09245 [Planctomycetota bacterium]
MRPLPLLLLLLAACAHGPVRTARATPEEQSLLFDRIAAMAGTWEVTVPETPPGTATFTVSSNGSIVREIMFPGTDHEMTNVYHMDGSTLVMTHYCAAGNQPRMRAHAEKGNTIRFAFDSVTDAQPEEHCMATMVLTFVDTDHATAQWSNLDATGVDGTAQFSMQRVK